MPLRCVDEHGTVIDALGCSQEQWDSLRERARKERNLRMPCCPARAVLKTSKLGTRFFAHKARGDCSWKPETAAHLQLKALALTAARQAGWKAQSEVTGHTPEGERWTADVLAWKGEDRVAVEIQWSGQTNEETWHRQRRYERSGVKGVWLVRQPGFPISAELPAACIGGSMEEGLRILVPEFEGAHARDRERSFHWLQDLSPVEFLRAVFEGRFLFGAEHARTLTFGIETGVMECWKCHALTRIVTKLSGRTGPHGRFIDVQEASSVPKLTELLHKAAALRTDIGTVKERFSHALGQSYLSNGCSECDALIGQFYEHEAYYVQEETVGMVVLAMGKDMGKGDLVASGCWGVWSEEELMDDPAETIERSSEETWRTVAVEGAGRATVRTSPVHPLLAPETSSPAEALGQQAEVTTSEHDEADSRPGFRIRQEFPSPSELVSSRGHAVEPNPPESAHVHEGERTAGRVGFSILSDFELPGGTSRK